MAGMVTRQIGYIGSEGRPLGAQFYAPEGGTSLPLVIGMHGGGWDQGSPAGFGQWGELLAGRSHALLALARHHFERSETPYPSVVEDFRLAIAFARENAAELGIDPDRIALMGASSGAYLAAMAALKQPCAGVKAVIGAYGVYDLMAEWRYEQVNSPFFGVSEWLLGQPLVDDRRRYFDASPIAYATRDRSHIRFLVAWGTDDNVVDQNLQSRPFAAALTQAGFDVTTFIAPHAQHYWLFEPLDDPSCGSSQFASRLVRFLENHL